MSPRWSYQAMIGAAGSPWRSSSTPDSPTPVTPTADDPVVAPRSATARRRPCGRCRQRHRVHLDGVPSTTHGVAAAGDRQLGAREVDDDGLDARRADVDADQHVAADACATESRRPPRFGRVRRRRLGDDGGDAAAERQRPGGVRDDERVAAVTVELPPAQRSSPRRR